MQHSLELYRKLVAQIREEARLELISGLRGGGRISAAPPSIKREVRREFKARSGTLRAAVAPRMGKAKSEFAQGSNGKGNKRKGGAIAKLMELAKAHIAANPGCSVKDIAAGVGCLPMDLQLPMKKLRKEKAVSMKGTRAGARYTAKP